MHAECIAATSTTGGTFKGAVRPFWFDGGGPLARVRAAHTFSNRIETHHFADDDRMPNSASTFGLEDVVGWAGPFIVTVSPDTPENRAAAEAIRATAEQDLATMEDWFSYRWSDFPYGIWVSVNDDGRPSPHADNTWYYRSQSPRIGIHGATLANAGGSPAIRDELARMLFVAELSEVFMHAAPTNWNPGNSAGEALSRVAAAELHPIGYYRPSGAPNNGPYSTAWLQLPWRRRDAQADGADPRYDFVTVSVGTDADALATGCGILFLYFLHDQLRYSWKQIASSNGDHLAETFAQLTGRPQGSAFTEFADVLDAHLPPGTSVTPAIESVFPLRAHPAVLLVDTYGASHGRRRDDSIGFATLKPGPLCPEKGYDYHVVDVTTPVTVVARAPGSFAPSFQWFVGGTRVRRGTADVTVRVRVIDTRPGTGEPALDDVPLRLRCTVTDFPANSRLDVVNLDFPGNIEGFEVKAVLSEAAVSVIPGLVFGTLTIAPRMRSYAMGMQWYQDVERCNPDALWQVGVYRNALVGKLSDLKNRPDPPPPDVLADLVAAAVRYADAARELSRTAPMVAGTLEELVPVVAAGITAADAVEQVEFAGHVFRSGRVAATGTKE